MFEDNIFEKWLDSRTKEIVVKMGNGEALTSDEMITLVLKAQTNHFVHLDQDLRTEMINVGDKIIKVEQDLRTEMINVGDKIIKVEQDLRSDMQEMNARLSQEMIDLRKDMDKRFEQTNADMNKRFEQVDKRFEQVDKRFEALTTRIDRFMIWSFATTITVGGIVIASIKFIN